MQSSRSTPFFSMGSVLHRCNADPDPACQFSADPDPHPHQGDFNLRTLAYRPFQGSILILHASILSVCGPPRLYFEPLNHLNFMRIRILLPKTMQIRNPDFSALLKCKVELPEQIFQERLQVRFLVFYIFVNLFFTESICSADVLSLV